jgi:hypothetical protein
VVISSFVDTTTYQVPRLKQRYTGLIHQNMSVILSEHQREVIFNPGYPFYYDAPQIFSWAIHADNYIKIAFLDVSLKRPGVSCAISIDFKGESTF